MQSDGVVGIKVEWSVQPMEGGVLVTVTVHGWSETVFVPLWESTGGDGRERVARLVGRALAPVPGLVEVAMRTYAAPTVAHALGTELARVATHWENVPSGGGPYRSAPPRRPAPAVPGRAGDPFRALRDEDDPSRVARSPDEISHCTDCGRRLVRSGTEVCSRCRPSWR